ncbi:MAG: O-antigen polymerase [Magnetococcales bacterium]|nr:O-antigen polymerase [Magnetococcales bacterium]
MRDLLLTLIVFGSLPLIFVRPHYGVYMWAWLTYMTPHRLTWGFAYDFRFNYFVAIVTLIAIIKSKDIKIRVPMTIPTIFWLFFILWTLVTTYNAFEYSSAWAEWDRFLKIQIMVIVTYIIIKDKKQIIILAGVIAFSIGFFGFKGGLFTLVKGGYFRVMGPEYSFISDNNTFALALNMTLPLSLYFLQAVKNPFVRLGLLLHSFLCVLAIFGSYSRGGLVGLLGMGTVFWFLSKKKFVSTLIILLIVPSAVLLMPEKWMQRVTPMIESLNIQFLVDAVAFNPGNMIYKELPEIRLPDSGGSVQMLEEVHTLIKKDAEILQDLSVLGRFDAWQLSKAVAADRPFLGGGFGTFSQGVFDHYTPGVYRHDAHSIYFEVLGEQGYFGLLLWVLMHLTSLNYGRWTIMRCRKDPELQWASVLAKMLIIGLLGYYFAGISLGLAYYDLPYHYLSLLVLIRLHVRRHLKIRLETEMNLRKKSSAFRVSHVFPVRQV